MGLIRRRDPRDEWPEQMSLLVEDVFFLKGRGTVLTGRLEGNGSLWEGDWVIHSRGESPVQGVHSSNDSRKVGPGPSVGVLVGPKVDPEGFRGQILRFRRGVDQLPGRYSAGPARRYQRPP